MLTLNQGVSVFRALPVSRHTKPGRKQVQHSWPAQTKEVFHAIDGHAQLINWGIWLGAAGHSWGPGQASISKWRPGVVCITCGVWRSIPLSLFHYVNITLIIVFVYLWYFSLLQSLNYSYLNPSVLSFSCSPHNLTADRAEQG